MGEGDPPETGSRPARPGAGAGTVCAAGRSDRQPAYSAFFQSDLDTFLREKRIETLVLTGAETDVCVLATALAAVDRGFRVVIVEDAICSSSDAGHDALMTMYRDRLHEQIEVVSAAHMLAVWIDDH